MKNRLLMAVVAVAAACGDMEHAPTSYTPAANRMATKGDDEDPPVMPVASIGRGSTGLSATPPVAPPPTSSAPDAMRVVVLSPLGSASLQGSVALISQGRSTVASTTLTGGAPGTSYRGAVREGSCDVLAARVASLLDVTVDTAGTGRSATILTIPADSLLQHAHAIVYGKGGRPETCGEIGGGGAPAADTTGFARPGDSPP